MSPRPHPPTQGELDEITRVRRLWHLEDLQKWQMRPTGDPREEILTDEELEEIADRFIEVEDGEDPSYNYIPHYRLNYIHNGRPTPPRVVRNIVIAKDLLEGNPMVEELKKYLIEDFTGTVFRSEVWPDPPKKSSRPSRN